MGCNRPRDFSNISLVCHLPSLYNTPISHTKHKPAPFPKFRSAVAHRVTNIHRSSADRAYDAGRENAVCIVIRYRAGGFGGSNLPMGNIFHPLNPFRPAVGPTQPPVQWV